MVVSSVDVDHIDRTTEDEYLHVSAIGISIGEAGLQSCNKVSENLRHLKVASECKGNHQREVFGAVIFSCSERPNSFYEHPGIDSSPFLQNFPGVALGGTYCDGEICRGNLNLYDQENGEVDLVICSEHVYSAVYLVMSYSPPIPQG